MNEQNKPPAITEEKPARNLASLVSNKSFDALAQTLIHQWNIREAFNDVEQFGIRPLDRALFYGPPGNGKTMAAQLIANKTETKLFRVKCESLITGLLGSTESNMANVMDWLSKQGESVVLFDECEAIFPARKLTGGDSCSAAIVRSMQIFWQALDRWETPQLFLLATNLVENLDAALLSRMELKIEFKPPTKSQALKVVEYWAETLHEYGADVWGKSLTSEIKGGREFESFRLLWHTIASFVRNFISESFEA